MTPGDTIYLTPKRMAWIKSGVALMLFIGGAVANHFVPIGGMSWEMVKGDVRLVVTITRVIKTETNSSGEITASSTEFIAEEGKPT